MNDSEREDLRKAVEHLRGNRVAYFYIKRALGEETQYEEIDGHVFKQGHDEKSWCLGSGCDMSKKSLEFAGHFDCPANMEGIDCYRPTEGF